MDEIDSLNRESVLMMLCYKCNTFTLRETVPNLNRRVQILVNMYVTEYSDKNWKAINSALKWEGYCRLADEIDSLYISKLK